MTLAQRIAMKAPWQKLWNNWLARRSQRSPRITFTQRTVYIVPSRGGFLYALVVLILLLAAINEQLNLAYALAFLLGGVGLSSMSLTHANLRGLSLTLGTTHSVHAGETLHVPVVLDASDLKNGRFGLLLNEQVNCEVAAGQCATFEVMVPTQQRGWVSLQRWPIQNTYPVGLFKAWGYWKASPAILIWPALDPVAPPLPGANDGNQEHLFKTSTQPEQQDEIREWQRGDALRSVIWKKSATRIACGLTPVVRQNSASSSPSVWIDWEMTVGLSSEARLSRLATWLVRAETQSLHIYGLRMPGCTIACSQGQAHLTHCLDTLAAWNSDQSNLK